MQINQLSTINFKRMGTKEITFTPGLNFISGENGAGKTTVLRAIATALFGPQMLPGTADMIPTFGQNRWEVELDFEHEGGNYTIKRTKSTANLFKDGELVASGNTPCTKYMEDLFGIVARDYNLLIHSRQGETAGVLNYGATALQRKVEEFAGVEVVERVAVLAGAMEKDLKSTAEVRMDVVKDYSSEIAEVQAQVDDLQTQMRQLSELPPTPVEPDITVPKIASLRSAYRAYLNDLEHYNERKSELEEALIEKLGDEPVVMERSKLKELNSQLRQLKDSNKAKAEAAWKLQQLKDQIQDLEEPEELPDSEALADGLETRKEAAQSVHREIAHLTAMLKDSKCSACGTVLEEINTEDIQDQITRLQEQRKDAESEVAKQEDRIRAAVRLAKLHQQWADNEELKARVAEMKVEPQEPTEQLEDQIALVRLDVETTEERWEAWDRDRRRIERTQKQLDSLEEPTAVQEVTDEQVQKVSDQWDKYQEDRMRYQEAVNAGELLKHKLEDVEEDLEYFLGMQRKSEEAKEVAAGEFAKAETAGNLQKFLRDKRSTYLNQVWESITAYASDFLHESSGGWLTAVKVVDNKFFFKEDGAWIPTDEASGAQESFVGVALRVGISKALYSRGFYLVFDEPTDGMTEDRARSLIASLSGTAGQVFVITHRETDQALADNIVEV